MLQRRAIGGLFLAFVILFLTSCSTKISPWVHFKIIVDVEADGKTYSGSSVLGMQFANRTRTGQKGLYHSVAMKGEAPFVEVGDHGTLFALLSVNKNGGFTSNDAIFFIPINSLLGSRSSDLVVDMTQLSKMEGKGSELSCLEESSDKMDCPVLARFDDINVPTSIEQVDPKYLAKSFGPGVNLKSIRFEITDEPITEKIAAKLPWLMRTPELEYGIPVRIFGKIPDGIPRKDWPFSARMHDGFFKMDYKT
ncbi:MAG: hypothetical protein GW850_08390 [Sphingomonadales bacterium]|nr:hypothetical protein [Sphingomonadales bacterium]NCO99621.1 hypothetical protein [Sphingomonadales bacterium]NCP49203.1 hypothetical protein [Sphingomonadales bacterium]NCQ48502.1 hypothetical protein [Sphingomonadales bacterium]